jgi:hypothetical protein
LTPPRLPSNRPDKLDRAILAYCAGRVSNARLEEIRTQYLAVRRELDRIQRQDAADKRKATADARNKHARRIMAEEGLL